MYMQIRLPLACFLIMVYCFGFYRLKARLYTKTSQVFEAMVVTTIINLAASVVTEYTVNNRDKVPEAFNYIWHVVFLVSLTCTVSLLLYYLLLYIERGTGERRQKEKGILLVVCAVGIVTQVFLPIRYIDTPYGAYSHGMKAYSLYGVVLCVLVIMLVEVIRCRKMVGKRESSALSASVAICVIISIIQISCPYLLITSLGLTLIMLGIMVNMEDVHLYVSYKTGMCNELGCREIIQENVFSGRAFQIGVYVFLGEDKTIEEAVRSLESKFLEDHTNLICGMMADNVFVALPMVRWSGAVQPLGELPAPDVEGSLNYTSKILNFDGRKSAMQIQEAIRDYKNRYEEGVLYRDELTGLLRREAFIRQVNYLIAQETPFSFMMVDLDDFKSINDRFGHNEGDKVLKFTADIFRSVVRNSDVICRMGGDEFAIALTGVTEEELVREIMNRIIEKMYTAQILPDKNHKIRMSAGVKIYKPENGVPSFQELYAEADSALYHTKYNGKNGVSFA